MAAFTILEQDRAKLGEVIIAIVTYARLSVDQFAMGPFTEAALESGFMVAGDVAGVKKLLLTRWPRLKLVDADD